MLRFLHIENIAVIESCDIEFTEGFNVLTGETGAGKSIVIDSINAVLGERTSKDLIRSGCDSATVSALFSEIDTQTLQMLCGFDIEPDDDGNVLVTRKLSLNGKGAIKINGKPSTAAILKEISQGLINIHGQHDNQALLNPEKHCDFIDAVADNSDIRDGYYEEFKNLNKIRKELQSLEMDEDEKARKIDLLKYQIGELETADIKIGEITELKRQLEIAENFENNIKGMRGAKQIFAGDDNLDGVITNLKIAAKLLANLKIDEAKTAFSGITELIAKAEDVSSDITSFLDSTENESLNVDDINQRLDLLYRLMVKYGNSEEACLKFLDNAKKELDGITFSDKRADELANELQLSKERLVFFGDKLTESRVKAARTFESDVCDVLQYLNMPGVKFVTRIDKGRYTKFGCDEVEFKISANKGEEVKPLAKIASGGELSRVMLAIKSSLLDKDTVGTMIFDEIDSGISGFAADKVGDQLRKVSKKRQVICITHLAQIAARADNHLLIEKQSDGERTKTQVTVLDKESRINEIARIMSGTQITENLYNSAKELLDRSQKNDNL